MGNIEGKEKNTDYVNDRISRLYGSLLPSAICACAFSFVYGSCLAGCGIQKFFYTFYPPSCHPCTLAVFKFHTDGSRG